MGAELLFGLLTDLYERGSVLITSNLDFASWTEVFGDPRLSRPPSRILDGVPTHHHYTHGWVTFRPSRFSAIEVGGFWIDIYSFQDNGNL